MTDNSNWVQQEDGTTLPSEKLLNAVRENPDKFPNAVNDFAKLSGKSTQEVQGILDNKSYSDSVPILGHIADGAVDLYQGLGRAGTALTEKQAYLARKVGLNGVADFLQEDTDASRTENAKIDPKFITEVGLGETITEGIGQAAPAIAAGIATGGSGFLATGAASAGVGYLTFEDEDNLVQLADEYTDGIVPDFLVIQEDDDEDVKRLKGAAGHLISEFALAGAGHLIGRVWKSFRRGDPKVIQETLEATAGEAGVALDDVADVTASVSKGRMSIADFAASNATPKQTAEELGAEVAASAKAQNLAVVAAKEAGEEVVEHVPSRPLVSKFRSEAMGALDATLKRSSSTNAGKRLEIANFRKTGRDAYVKQSESVLKALYSENYDEAVDLIANFRTTNNPEYDALWKGSVLKASLEQTESRFDDIITAIRKDPTLKTRKAWKEVSGDIYQAKLKMAEMYRESGSGSSYALLNRKLGIKSTDKGLIDALDNAEVDLRKFEKDNGYNILSSKADFMLAKSKNLDELGINPMMVMDELDTMFKEFDDIRQGTLASMRTNSLNKLTKAEKAALENSFIRVLHDFHSSALLGQPSTAGLEVVSNFLQNLTMPLNNIIGANKLSGLSTGATRAAREYQGYRIGWGQSWDAFKKAYIKGKSITDNFDALDGAHASKIDYDHLLDNKKFATYAFMRLYKFAADISIGASEAQKTWRAFGSSYADGMELGSKAGLKGKALQKKATEYAHTTFTSEGGIRDVATMIDVQRTSWQSVIDSRYRTGSAAQAIENFRNSTNPIVSTLSRATIPFFRTLVNIGGDAAQTVMPLPSSAIKALSKTKLGNHAIMSARFLDDFTGRNGAKAMVRAQARQRMGALMIGGTYGLIESGAIQITPPSGYESWNAKMAKWETLPPSSLIIGDTSIDLTRFLPFSAPLLLAGIVHETARTSKMEMKDGDYIKPEDTDGMFAIYGSSLMILSTSLMSDAGSMRGIGELFEAMNTAVSDGDARAMLKLGTNYGKQFMPALPRVVGKNTGFVDGDWEQYRGEGWIEEVLASAGYKYGYKKLDFLGYPVKDKGRGLDPFNVKAVKVNEDPLYREYAQMSQDAELGLSLPSPSRVFDKTFWQSLGKNSTTLEYLLKDESVSLNQLKTKDGKNAYDVYRDMVYNGTAQKDITKSTSGSGDRISIGSVEILKGENMEAALRRYVSSEVYHDLTPIARKKVWSTIFGVFKKNAKEAVAAQAVVSPDVFKDSKYGSPISEPTSIAETTKLAKDRAKEVQTTRGIPETSLDEIFAIK